MTKTERELLIVQRELIACLLKCWATDEVWEGELEEKERLCKKVAKLEAKIIEEEG